MAVSKLKLSPAQIAYDKKLAATKVKYLKVLEPLGLTVYESFGISLSSLKFSKTYLVMGEGKGFYAELGPEPTFSSISGLKAGASWDMGKEAANKIWAELKPLTAAWKLKKRELRHKYYELGVAALKAKKLPIRHVDKATKDGLISLVYLT